MICAHLHTEADVWPQAIRDALKDFHPELTPFRTRAELSDLALRTLLDLVLIPVLGSEERALKIVHGARTLPALAAVPVVVWHPNPDGEAIRRFLESPVDDLLIGAPTDPAAAARLRMAVRRSWRDLDVNPSSRLPGPTTIERVISEMIAGGEEFAVCYADLDDFKAYNDYYGYFYGDRVIKMCSRIIRETVHEFQPDGFVGHIGGDDFVYLIRPPRIKRICEAVLKRFDAEIPLCYEPRDRRNGYIISKDRRGTAQTYSLMNLSIAVVINRNEMFKHVGEISHMVADLKRYVKSLPGSNYMVERRSKY
ncbi:MAG TPA: diguanylate cyclase [candidate division Zixibacteria bacterium]|jgi:GGDEF domain-containing protein